jgi:hypothetical protein
LEIRRGSFIAFNSKLLLDGPVKDLMPTRSLREQSPRTGIFGKNAIASFLLSFALQVPMCKAD